MYMIYLGVVLYPTHHSRELHYSLVVICQTLAALSMPAYQSLINIIIHQCSQLGVMLLHSTPGHIPTHIASVLQARVSITT